MYGLDIAMNYVGAADREAPIEEARIPRCPIHRDIDRITSEVEAISNAKEAANTYLMLRVFRHDNWIDFINTCSARGIRVGDVKVGPALVRAHRILGKHRPISDEIINLTPDLLYFDAPSKKFIIGDLTISSLPRDANRRKIQKYSGVLTHIESMNEEYLWVDLAISVNGLNITSKLQNLEECGLIEINWVRFNSYLRYHEYTNNLMELCLESTNNRSRIVKMLKEIDGNEYVETYAIPELPIEISGIPVEEYIPILTEDEIIKSIKEETDKINPEEYFTNDIEKTLNEFDKIIEKNKKGPHMDPRSTLKFVDNQNEFEPLNDHDLVYDYIVNLSTIYKQEVASYILYLLPSSTQIKKMKDIKLSRLNLNDLRDKKYCDEDKVFGSYQYDLCKHHPPNDAIAHFKVSNVIPKYKKYIKKEPRHVDMSKIDSFHNFISYSMDYYGSVSKKPPIFDDSWNSKTPKEVSETEEQRSIYNYVKSTNGAQLTESVSGLYERIIHLNTAKSKKTNIYTPPNGSFICIIPDGHKQVNRQNVEMPFIVITRCRLGEVLDHIEYEYSIETYSHKYYISKIFRLNMDKIVNWSCAGTKLVATASNILFKCPSLIKIKRRLVGFFTFMILDIHQKTSEFLDLLKYISFMPFSDISRLPDLIKDKMDMLFKTRLDAYLLKHIKHYVYELSIIDKLQCKKRQIRIFNGVVSPDCLGIELHLPSFIDPNVRHKEPTHFVEEINMTYTLRPKHLYGYQFMDKSITNLALWNNEYDKETEQYGGWTTVGHDNEKEFPYGAKFAFCADTIHYAELKLQDANPIEPKRVEQTISRSVFNSYMFDNCSLRGCTLDKRDRKDYQKIHSSSIDVCLNKYKENDYDESYSKSSHFAIRHLLSGEPQEYAMSEKDQRGGGRPIATGTLGTKACLMMIEKPEGAKGKYLMNNIVVENKNKPREQCEAYKTAIVLGSAKHKKFIYQLTEDQSKFSENDNTRKYESYIRTDKTVPLEIKKLQLASLKGMIGRHHLIKNIPDAISSDPVLKKHLIIDEKTLGVKTYIGWPQGMLNNISTNLHCAADIWITYAYNKAYPDDQVVTKGLVHSDDSWITVCCDSEFSFKRFALFRLLAKMRFCLKINIKKLWGSKYLGELVSNFNLNGNVHLSVSKTLGNSFGNLNFQSWMIDVHSQISVLQQCYRNGADIPTLILLSTILEQQIKKAYNVKGMQLELLHNLPVELGGYPYLSAFEMATCGVTCHYKNILAYIRMFPESKITKIINNCIVYSSIKSSEIDSYSTSRCTKENIDTHKKIVDLSFGLFSEDDFEAISIPFRGDFFKAVYHLMPKTPKMSRALNTIRSLPFESDGLELITSKASSLKEALGRYKALTSSKLFELASEKYTQNVRRLAISQAMQSSGKVVKLHDHAPQTFNEMYCTLLALDTKRPIDIKILNNSFLDDDDLIICANNIVYQSEIEMMGTDKRKVISKMPEIENKFKTICSLTDVLLNIIDQNNGTTTLFKYGSERKLGSRMINMDSIQIRERFASYFKYFNAINACSMIMQQYMSASKARLWIQPHLRNDTLLSFMEDLYGKTLSRDYNFSIRTKTHYRQLKTLDQSIIQTIYCTTVLNNVYKDNFKIERINGMRVSEQLNRINYQTFDFNDMLKYSICQYILCNNKDPIDATVRLVDYQQWFKKRQNMVNGQYVGEFDVYCRYRGVQMHIVGQPGDIQFIETTNIDVNKILDLMSKFVLNNFRNMHYPEGQWPKTGFWKNKLIFQLARYSFPRYLKYNSSYSTELVREYTSNSVPILFKIDIEMPSEITSADICQSYEFDIGLRVIYGIKNNIRLRITTVYQNFKIPCRNDVNLAYSNLEGYVTEDLYKTGIMEHLVTGRLGDISVETVKEIMVKRGGLSAKIVMQSLVRLIKKIGISVDYEPPNNVVEVTTETIKVIGGMGMDQVVEEEKAILINPESLEAVRGEFEYEDETAERIGSVYKIKNIEFVLCLSSVGTISEFKSKYFIYCIMVDRRMVDIIKDAIRDEEKMSDIIHFCEGIFEEIDIELYCYIIASKINTESYWSGLDFRSLRRTYENFDDSYTRKMAESFVSAVVMVLFEEEEEPEVDLFGLHEELTGTKRREY